MNMKQKKETLEIEAEEIGELAEEVFETELEEIGDIDERDVGGDISNPGFENSNTDSGKTLGSWATTLFFFLVVFLLVSGFIALLLAPPFGTALAILIFLFFAASR
jgi:hypothetical protein